MSSGHSRCITLQSNNKRKKTACIFDKKAGFFTWKSPSIPYLGPLHAILYTCFGTYRVRHNLAGFVQQGLDVEVIRSLIGIQKKKITEQSK